MYIYVILLTYILFKTNNNKFSKILLIKINKKEKKGMSFFQEIIIH